MSGRSALQTLLGLCLAFLACAALGAEYVEIERRLTPEQMSATGLDMLSEQQLQLLNQLLRAPDPAVAEATPTPAPEATPASVATPALTSASASTPAPAVAVAPAAQSSGLLGQDRPIRARVQGTVGGWEPGTVFVLDNGQRWQVLKGRAELPQPLQSPEILVVSGLAGRYFLQVSEDLPKARVYRID